VRKEATAVGYLRGNKAISVPLKFVRFEPYVIPKVSLTGESTERVDTRVLQAIYSFERGNLPIYVGQQMNVYIDALSRENRNRD
jgi:HlyD family secretion protein